MDGILLVDFGSTYTKVIAVDADKEEILGRSQSSTTIDTDIMLGLNRALDNLQNEFGVDARSFKTRYACSSAAGGLKMIAIGLVPQLTLEAARRAALGAGAKVTGAYGYEVGKDVINEIQSSNCDIIMLAGGTDGGNKNVILHNAEMLAGSEVSCPVLVCGNSNVSDEIGEILTRAGKQFVITENVMPSLERMNPEPVQRQIREIFIEHIIKAKGLSNAADFIGKEIIPTPLASLRASQLISEGTPTQQGLGTLMVVEIGGATVNVHSIGINEPVSSKTVMRGLPEAKAKRTVEGDLGIRWNSQTIWEITGEDALKNILKGFGTFALQSIDGASFHRYVDILTAHVGHVPENELEFEMDIALVSAAAERAVRRHAGTVHSEYSVMGDIVIQTGKNLMNTKNVIGTGGIFK